VARFKKKKKDILSAFKMKPDVKKIQKITEANGYDMFGEWTKTDWYT